MRDRVLPSSYLASGEIVRIGSRAIRIRRELEDIDVLERRKALDLGRRLRLNRASARWQKALELALAVLASTEYVPSGGRERHRTIEVRLNTAAMWQSVLGQALRIAAESGAVVLHAKNDWKVPAPWIPVQGAPRTDDAYPDYLVSTMAPPHFWCLDAKYKILEAPSAPSNDDRYQMFAYSHLAEAMGSLVPSITHAGLLYPAPVDGAPPADKVRYDRGGHGAPAIPLYVQRLAFPMPSDVQSDSNWQSYLVAISARLVAFVTA